MTFDLVMIGSTTIFFYRTRMTFDLWVSKVIPYVVCVLGPNIASHFQTPEMDKEFNSSEEPNSKILESVLERLDKLETKSVDTGVDQMTSCSSGSTTGRASASNTTTTTQLTRLPRTPSICTESIGL